MNTLQDVQTLDNKGNHTTLSRASAKKLIAHIQYCTLPKFGREVWTGEGWLSHNTFSDMEGAFCLHVPFHG
jgi:hypothetical protein